MYHFPPQPHLDRKRNFRHLMAQHDLLHKTNYYAIVKITINPIARTLIRDRNRDISLVQELVQSTMANCLHTGRCMKEHTVGDTTTLPGTTVTPESQGTAGTANSPQNAELPDLQTQKTHETPRTSRRSRLSRQQFYQSHNTSDPQDSPDSQSTSRLKRHSKSHPNYPAGHI